MMSPDIPVASIGESHRANPMVIVLIGCDGKAFDQGMIDVIGQLCLRGVDNARLLTEQKSNTAR